MSWLGNVGDMAKKAGSSAWSDYGNYVNPLGKHLVGWGNQGLDSLDRNKAATQQYGSGGTPGDYGVPGFDAMNNGYRENAQQRSRLGDMYGGRAAPMSDQRGNQLGLGNMLLQEAQGNGVGQNLVRMQAREAANRASAQQFAALGGARPGMQAMAARNAMLGTALAQGGVGQNAAMGSAQMTLGAQNAYGQHLQGVRGQDESTQLASRQLNDNSQLNAYGQQMQLMQQRQNLAGMQQQGNQQYQQNQTQRYGALMGQPTKGETVLGGFTGLGGALMGM